MVRVRHGFLKASEEAIVSLLVFELWYDQLIRLSAERFRHALFQAPRATGEAST